MTASRYLPLVLIAVLAFALRLGWAAFVQVDVRTRFLWDPSIYDMLARSILDGQGLSLASGPTAFFPPGYPALLAACYFLFGADLTVAWTLNAGFAAITCVLTYALARTLFGHAVGLASALVFALFPGNVFAAAHTLSEASFTAVFMAALLAFVIWSADAARHDRGRRWFAFGATLGVATLLRGVALPFAAVPALLWAFADGLRVSLRRTLFTALGMAVLIAPWTLRNYLVMGAPIPLSTDGAYAFFQSHNPQAQGEQIFEMEKLREQLWPQLYRLENPEREVERQSLELRYGLEYMLTHPMRELRLVVNRLYYMYRGDHWALFTVDRKEAASPAQTLEFRVIGPRADAFLVDLADGYFYLVLLLAAVGAFSKEARRGRAPLLAATVLFISFLHGVLFFGDQRYHAPLAPILSILAAVGGMTMLAALQRVRGLVSERRARQRLDAS